MDGWMDGWMERRVLELHDEDGWFAASQAGQCHPPEWNARSEEGGRTEAVRQ